MMYMIVNNKILSEKSEICWKSWTYNNEIMLKWDGMSKHWDDSREQV